MIDNQVRLIIDCHNQWEKFKNIIKKRWNVLSTDPILKQILPTTPSIVAKRSRNLGDMLVRSHYEPKIQTEPKVKHVFFPCGFCKACGNLIRTKNFKNYD